MIDRFLSDLAAWWATVPPDFAFLLALPFVVAALGIGADRWRTRRARPAADAQAGARHHPSPRSGADTPAAHRDRRHRAV